MKKPPKNGRPDDDNPEWTKEDFRRAKPLSAFPDIERILRKHRGPQVAPTKVATNLRLDRDVITHLRASGRGWQGRANAALKRAIQRGTL